MKRAYCQQAVCIAGLRGPCGLCQPRRNGSRNPKRDAEIVKLKAEKSLRQIGAIHGISHERVRVIIARYG